MLKPIRFRLAFRESKGGAVPPKAPPKTIGRNHYGDQEISGGCASIPLKFRADCMVMVAAVMYRGSLIALLRVRIATFQQCVSRSPGDNSLISLMASPTVFRVVPLQTNSNDNGLVLINDINSTSRKEGRLGRDQFSFQ